MDYRKLQAIRNILKDHDIVLRSDGDGYVSSRASRDAQGCIFAVTEQYHSSPYSALERWQPIIRDERAYAILSA